MYTGLGSNPWQKEQPSVKRPEYIKKKWPIWEKLRLEVGMSGKGCVVGQVTRDRT